MLKISLVAVGMYCLTLAGFAQNPTDSTTYKDRTLRLEESNFVSSYYIQDGNNSAVTGGVGSEHLTDFATTIDVKLSRYSRTGKKITWIGEVGLDVYTSASSDKIDPATISSASSSDKRIYPSITYIQTDEDKGSSLSVSGSVSTEYDYFSTGFSIGWSKVSKDRNREFGVKGLAFFDTWTVILPIELRDQSNLNGTLPRNSYSASLTLSQVVTKKLQLLAMADFAHQDGQLATLYHRTYFSDGNHEVESLPDNRFKIPIGLRMNYFLGDNFIFRAYYRYYQDTWQLKAHTAELEVPVKITPFLSISPFYRYYKQKGVKYFAPYQQHNPDEEFYTSDYDLSSLTSNMYGAGLRYAPPGGIAGLAKFNSMEIRCAHYDRSTGLAANIISLLLKYR
jgi:hypothetical protein